MPLTCQFQRDLEPVEYEKLMLAATEACTSFSLITQESQFPSTQCIELLESLREHTISKKQVSSWPGTQLSGGQATLYEFRCNDETYHWLTTHGKNIYAWLQPDRPEDLAFYRNDRNWFYSCSHEEFAGINFEDEKEKADLFSKLPFLKTVLAFPES